MKAIVLMLAVLAMVGYASAWDQTQDVVYKYTNTFYMQADDPECFFEDNPYTTNCIEGAQSGAHFIGATPYGKAAGDVENLLLFVESNTVGSGLCQPSQTLTLTQGGEAVVVDRAKDSQDKYPEVTANVYNYQNLHFSGDYTGGASHPQGQFQTGEAVGAAFETEGNAGIDGVIRVTATAVNAGSSGNIPSGFGGTWEGEIGMVESQNAHFTEADVGMSSASGVALDKVTGLITTSGKTTAYSSFTGGFQNPNDLSSFIQTDTGNYETTQRIDYQPIITSGSFVVPNGNNFPGW